MSAIQLSLFPLRGFGLLALGKLLEATDGLPTFRRSQRAARSLLRRGVAPWLAAYASVVPVTIHEDSDDDGRPTYVIGETS